MGGMVALRSRRLQTLLGAALDDLQYHHIEALVTNHVGEAFDLDFKETLYGNGDRDRRDLATDVAALANTAGGLLILGVAEDSQATASAAPGVALSDDEIRRILQIVASLVAPLPVFDLLPIPKPGADSHGFLVVAVARGAAAPHAVIVNQGFRYPRRNGTTTRYLAEPELASAYRERFAGAQRQAARIEQIEYQAKPRLDGAGPPWAMVSLVPDLPGDVPISGEVFSTFRQEITHLPDTATPLAGTRFYRASVGQRRLLADSTLDNSPLAKSCSLELHSDGSGVCSFCLPDIARNEPAPDSGEPVLHRVQDENLVIALISALLLLAQHARDRAAAGGNALVHAQIFPISGERPVGLGHTRQYGFLDVLGTRALTSPPPAAEAAGELDLLAEPGPALISATAILVNEIGQAFGVPEMGQLTPEGQVRHRYWRNPPFVTWAEHHGIEVTDGQIVL